MLREALQKLEDMALAGKEARHFHVPGDPPHVRRLALADGTVQKIETDPAPRVVTAQTIAGLLDMVAEPFHREAQAKPVVFVSDEHIKAVFDITTGREWAYLPLVSSPAYDFLAGQREDPMVQVRELRQALQFELEGAWEQTSPDLLERVSNLDTRAQADTTERRARDRETLGASVNQQVAQETPLPEEKQVFDIRPYGNMDLKQQARVTCRLEPNLEHRCWMLRPTDNSWQAFHEEAYQMVLDICDAQLQDMNIPIVRGDLSQPQAGAYQHGDT